MPPIVDYLDWIYFVKYRDAIAEIVAQRHPMLRDTPTHLRLTANPDAVGVPAEVVWAIATGQRIHRTLPLGETDRGEDFPGIDVKGTATTRDPHLLVAPKRTGQAWADRYILIALDFELMRGKIVGEASGDAVQTAPRLRCRVCRAKFKHDHILCRCELRPVRWAWVGTSPHDPMPED